MNSLAIKSHDNVRSLLNSLTMVSLSNNIDQQPSSSKRNSSNLDLTDLPSLANTKLIHRLHLWLPTVIDRVQRAVLNNFKEWLADVSYI